MISKAEALELLRPLSLLEREALGRFIKLYNGNVSKFIYWSETFHVFQDGKLDFSVANCTRVNPFVLVNTESAYYPVSWPEEWGMMHIGSSFMEEVYQRTCFP